MQDYIVHLIDRVPQKFKTAVVAYLDGLYCLLIYYLTSLSAGFSWSNIDLKMALIFSILNVLLSFIFKNYHIIWDLYSYRNIKSIVLSTLLSSIIIKIVTNGEFQVYFYVLLFLLSFCLISTSRVAYANWRNFLRTEIKGENILVIGAGEAGAQVFLQLKNSPMLKLNPIGFLDDSSEAQKRHIHGAPVLGKVSDIKWIKEKFGVEKALVAIPSAEFSQLRAIYRTALDAGVEVSTLPPLKYILEGKVNPFQIKDIEPQDLLSRDPITLDQTWMNEVFVNKTIMITGAGGSIGSELCCQIAMFSPEMIVLFEQTELFLYELEMKLRLQFPSVTFIPIIGDVRDIASLDSAVSQYTPDLLFHAAAYKHVPLMESNPGEAVVTNVIGTTNAVLVAAKYKVPRVVLISTDKAVNPTNIMGATKRAAEIACQICAEDYPDTKFMVVRFGNVLGSSGSVIPLFKKQIALGGPVTVTHKEVVRYFMSIPEACQLVMQAGSMGSGGELFVLEMGDPVKIFDLATDMIRLSGFKPGVDIQIEFTGLRSGEKLYEELLSDKETTLDTKHPKIRIAKCLKTDQHIRRSMSDIQSISRNTSSETIVKKLKILIPEFTHKP
jgi:FlaA1/EpsC-like NDP-sugar epimerase